MAARSARKRHAARNRPAATGRGAGQRRPWWRRWWMGLLVVPAMFLGALGLLAFFLMFSRVPLPEDIAAQASVVFDVHGEEVGGLAAEVSRDDVPIGSLPEHVPYAVLGVEDRGFYEHRGISVTGVLRALFTNVRAGSVQEGGSTVSQQYIKNAEVGTEQTYTRKVQEAALAIKLEQAYSKDEILEFYLNTVYWGRGAYGIEAAAHTYFDVPAADLTINQAATLAGMIASPENLDPIENPDRVDARRQVSLTGMLEQGWIDQATHDEVAAEGLPEVIERRETDLGPEGYYIDAVRRVLGQLPEFQGGELFRGLRIFTELDPRLQAAAQRELTQAVREGPTDTGAIVSIDPRTGGVRALVGGPDAAQQPLNTALVSARQVGSTFKAVTLQAFVEAGHSPASRYAAPAEYEVEDAQQPIRNFGGSSFGEQTVEQATASSTNTVFVQMQEEVGREQVIDAARRAGLPRDKSEEPFHTQRENGPTMRPLAGMTLGQDSFTPLEMASAFGTYAAEGLHVTPHLITRIENADGAVIWEPDLVDEQSVDIEVARTVTDGLRRVIESGSGTAADIGRPAAGKTGTTNDARDVWFVGYVPQLATGVWLGNLDNSEIDGEATGGRLAAPTWAAYMSEAVEDLEVEEFVPPDLSGLETVDDEPAACPPGYRFADPPSEADADGFFPDILTDITDDQGRPCVEVKPEPEPEPEPEEPEPEEPEPEEPEPEEPEPEEPEPEEPEPEGPDNDDNGNGNDDNDNDNDGNGNGGNGNSGNGNSGNGNSGNGNSGNGNSGSSGIDDDLADT